MKILVVYDSTYGNTEQIAHAIGNALKKKNDVRVLKAHDADIDHLKELDLLIVGSPTIGFNPSDLISNFLKKIHFIGLRDVKVTAFDTRLSIEDIKSPALRFLVKSGGYAARRIADRLKSHGGELIVPPEGFLVVGEEGPLKEGEMERAAQWAKNMMSIR